VQRRTPCARLSAGQPGRAFRDRAEKAPPGKILEEIDAVFRLDAPEAVRYDDSKARAAHPARRQHGACGASLGDTRSEPWLKDLWERAAPLEELRAISCCRSGRRRASRAARPHAVQLLQRFGAEIDAFLAKSNSIDELQASLKCGTNCGSCLPELRRKVSLAKTFEAVVLPLAAVKV